MKMDPTAGISGTAGTPLSHQAIDLGQKSAAHVSGKKHTSDAISDTLETSDREADGRQGVAPDQSPRSSDKQEENETGSRLDLTG